MPEEYLTLPEAAAYMRRSADTLYKWRSQGIGPAAAKAGRTLLYRRSEIDRYMRELEREPVGRAR
jgi:excisionase family DNA binding protein